MKFLTANKDKNFVKSHGREPDKFIKKQGEFSLMNSCCGSGPCWTISVFFLSKAVLRIRDVYPGSWFLALPDPGSNKNKKEEREIISCLTFFCNYKFHEIEFFCFFNRCSHLSKNTFTQKIAAELSEIWVGDPGSWIRDPGSWKYLSRIRIQLQKNHRIQIHNTNSKWKGVFSRNFFCTSLLL